jgi:hypothetical protein
MKFIFTLTLGVLFALVGRAQTLTVNGTIASASGTGPTWSPAVFPVETNPLKNIEPVSAFLFVTGFDFSALPPNATISGFEVTITRSADGTTISDNFISLIKAGTPLATNKANAAIWPNANTETLLISGAAPGFRPTLMRHSVWPYKLSAVQRMEQTKPW